jgi:hypothetical protein
MSAAKPLGQVETGPMTANPAHHAGQAGQPLLFLALEFLSLR